MMRRALISVSDKTGILGLAEALVAMGVEIIATHGTLEYLESHHIKALSVADLTGYPECLDGRMKTLHPVIFAAIMAERNNAGHMTQLESLHIEPIDMVVTNLYPFRQTLLKGNVALKEAMENIDIGGPALLRAAALNYRDVLVLVDPADYGPIMHELGATHAVSVRNRYKLAYKAFSHTSHYDTLIQNYFLSKIGGDSFPEIITLTYEKAQDLRYGENPHQRAAFYKEIGPVVGCLPDARQLHGKELSFNNINDSNGALELLKEFDEPTAVIIKHAHPCGVGSADTLAEAYHKAYTADTESAFGGIVAVNGEIDETMAQQMAEVFYEVIIAPAFTEKALEVLSRKKNLRLLALEHIGKKLPDGSLDLKKVAGGLLAQSYNNKLISDAGMVFATKRMPEEEELINLKFAMKVAKHARSNAIIVVKDKKTLGIGQGQASRVNAARIAIQAAKEEACGAVMASDAFLPFSDTVHLAGAAGITAIIQPGGSLKDSECINACEDRGISMVFTGSRHFKH